MQQLSSRGNICQPNLSNVSLRWRCESLRFVAATHHDGPAETIVKAIAVYNEMERRGLSTQFDVFAS